MPKQNEKAPSYMEIARAKRIVAMRKQALAPGPIAAVAASLLGPVGLAAAGVLAAAPEAEATLLLFMLMGGLSGTLMVYLHTAGREADKVLAVTRRAGSKG